MTRPKFSIAFQAIGMVGSATTSTRSTVSAGCWMCTDRIDPNSVGRKGAARGSGKTAHRLIRWLDGE